MIVRAIEFPVLGISSPGKGRRYAFVARTRDEMRECPLHAYWSGMLKEQYFGLRDVVPESRTAWSKNLVTC